LIAALSAVAEVPGRIENVFLNEKNELSQNGIYGLNMYTLGMPHTVLIDDYLPLIRQRRNKRNEKYTTIYANVNTDNDSIWGSLIEKAFSKYAGNYSRISIGTGHEAITSLTGAPAIVLQHASDSVTQDDVWA